MGARARRGPDPHGCGSTLAGKAARRAPHSRRAPYAARSRTARRNRSRGSCGASARRGEMGRSLCNREPLRRHKRELRDVSAPRGTTSSHVIFRVNFGERDGATPSRLLAMLCRRGKVQGNDVGSIRIGAAGSTFGIAPGVAEQLGSASSHVDAREPHIRIERLGDEAVRGPRDRRDPVADSRRAPHRDQPRPARAKTKHRDPARP